MKTKLFIWMLAILLLSSFASAVFPENNNLAYYSAQYNETNTTLSTSDTFPPYNSLKNWANESSYSLVASNSPSLLSNNLINAFSFNTGDNDHFNFGDVDEFEFASDFTLCSWIYPYSFSSPMYYISKIDGSTGGYGLNIETGGIPKFLTRQSGSWVTAIATETLNISEWAYVCAGIGGGNVWINVNGNAKSNTSTTGLVNINAEFRIGNQNAGTTFPLNGELQGVSIFNKSLTSSEISDIIAEGINYNPYYIQNFTITVTDNSTLNPILNFTANVSGTIYESNNTGSIVTGINTDILVNITLSSHNYFNNTYYNYNTSNSLGGMLDPLTLLDFELLTPNISITSNSTYNITWTEAESPTGKTVNYNVSMYYSNSTFKESFNTTDLYYNLDISNYNSGIYTVSVNGTEEATNIGYEHNSTLSIDFNNYVYFKDANTTNSLINNSVTVAYPSGNIFALLTDSEGKLTLSSFINDSLELGTYNITFEASQGYTTPITFYHTPTTLPFNISYNISRANININIYERETGNLLTKSSTIIIEGLLNGSTSTGIFNLSNSTITAGEYTITIASEGRHTEQQTILFTNQQSLKVDFYLLNKTDIKSSTITIRVIDDVDRLVSNAEVNLLEYDPYTLSYIQVSEAVTDSNGEAKFLIEVDDKTYKIIARKTINGQEYTAEFSDVGQIFTTDYAGGETVVFSEELLTLKLRFIGERTLDPTLFLKYSVVLLYNNISNTSSISVPFYTIDGHSTKVCVEYFIRNGSIKQSKTGSQYCAEGSSGEVTPDAVFLLNTSYTYIAEVYVLEGDARTPLWDYTFPSVFSLEKALEDNATVQPFIILLWVAILALGLWFEIIPLACILLIILSWVELGFFPNYLIGAGAVLKTLILSIVFYFARKKEDFE